MSTPQWNADIITPDDGSVDIAVNGGLVENEQGELGVSVDGESIVINSDGELQANIPTPDTVDQVYDSTSTHAQSGVAMAGALADYAPTASLATVATSGSYDDLHDKPTIPSLNVYVATYGVTTYQELSAAHTAEKAIFVTGVSGALSAIIPMTSFSSNPAMVIFTTVIGDIEYQAKIDQGVWSSTSVSLQADWNESNQLAPSYVANKPANLVQDASYVHTDNNFTTSLKDKLDGIASGAEVNVQADWNESNSSSDAYIQNKPSIPTVDQTYGASSPNAQSGTAVAEAIAGVRQVPSTQSSDNGKVLGVTDVNGTLGWVAQPTLASLNSAGITDIQQVASLPASPVATVLYLIPEA